MSANQLESRSAAAPQTTFTTRRVARTCHNADCGKNPYFGWHGEKAIFCVAHKEPGMVDVKNKRCEEVGCMKRGLFGFDGEKARFCGGHRLEGMVDLKNKRCKWVGCAKQATFAAEGKNTATLCSEHRSPGMVDVKGRRCETTQCTRQAVYGIPGEKPRFCLHHRQPTMVDVRPRASGPGFGTPPGTSSSSVPSDDDDAYLASSNSKRVDPGGGHETPQSFAEKWGKRTRTAHRAGAHAPTGVCRLGAEDGVVGDGELGSPQLLMNSHVDLLRPACRVPPSVLGAGHVGLPGAGGLAPELVVQDGAGPSWPSWRSERVQQLGGGGGALGLGSSAPGFAALSGGGNTAPLQGASSHGGVPLFRESRGGVIDSLAGVHSVARCAQSTNFDVTFSTDDVSTSESGIGMASPAMARSCSSLPIHGLGATSRTSFVRFPGGGGFSSSLARGEMPGPSGVGGLGTGGERWRSWNAGAASATATVTAAAAAAATSAPNSFTESLQASGGMLSGMDPHPPSYLSPDVDTGTVPVGVSHTIGGGGGGGSGYVHGGLGESSVASREDCGEFVASSSMTESPTRSRLRVKMEVNQPSDMEDDAEDGWLQDLMGVMGRGNGVAEMARPEAMAGGAPGGGGVDVRFAPPVYERPAPVQPDPVQGLLGRQAAFGMLEQQQQLQQLQQLQQNQPMGEATLPSVVHQQPDRVSGRWGTMVQGVVLPPPGEAGLFVAT